MMEKYKKLIFVIIVLLFFGCSSKSDDSSSLCNAGWNTCGYQEDCHCWRNGWSVIFEAYIIRCLLEIGSG